MKTCRKDITRRILEFFGAVLLFLALAYGFMPEVLGGKIVNQSDISGFIGMSHEMNDFNKEHPENPTAWTGAMFSGMPTTAIQAPEKGDLTKPVYDFLLLGKRPATYIFVSLLGAFLLMLAFGMNFFIAIAGAIAVSFCSYNFQIIQVGHNTKMQAIAFMPWVLAAIIYSYRSLKIAKKEKLRFWLSSALGSVLFAIALSFQIKANHQQITYYLAIIIFVYAISLFVWILSNKSRRQQLLRRFFIVSSMLLFVGIIGIATNANKLLPLYEYAEHTMRGGSELKNCPQGSEVNNKGLDLDYATAWSYGFNELPNLLIPNFNGGASSGAVNPKKSEVCKLLSRAGQPNVKEISQHLPVYWGPQPFTAGPMYMGAISVFLFVLALFVCDGREKWWIIIATLLAICLAAGNHMLWFTKLWFDYVPMYNKFRTVSMALIMLQVLIPLLGFLALNKILKGKIERKKLSKSLLQSYLIVGGFCLLMYFIPSLAGNFVGAADASMPAPLADALVADRMSLLSSDAWRSYIFVTLLVGILYFFLIRKEPARKESARKEPARKNIAYVGILVAILVSCDMFTAGKRYLNSSHFTTPKVFASQFDLRPVDAAILEDEDPDYRVADLTTNIFNDSHASYYHKNIGGYSPAKLQRYQDLINAYLNPELNILIKSLSSGADLETVHSALSKMPLVNALNTKYFIISPDSLPIDNPFALGHCWFVENAVSAATPDDELALLGSVDLKKTAVVGADFKPFYDLVSSNASSLSGLGGNTVKSHLSTSGAFAKSETSSETSSETLSETSLVASSIKMVSYAPNALTYKCSLDSPKAVVFSEIYYPDGWTAELKFKDGTIKHSPIYRADWIFRAMYLPEGEYELTMRFAPSSYKVGRIVSETSSIVLIILLLVSIVGIYYFSVSIKKKDNHC